MRRDTLKFVVLVIILLAFPSEVFAKCGLHTKPSYSDIDAVGFIQTGSPTCEDKCPSFELLFSKIGLFYVGRKDIERLGTWEAHDPKALQSVIAILKRNDFFSISAVPTTVTAKIHLIIAVERCDIFTRLDFSDGGTRPDIERLFSELNSIATQVHWQKTSDSTESPLSLIALASGELYTKAMGL